MKILIVDDSESKIKKIREVLTDFNDSCDYLIARTVSEATKILKVEEHIGLMILDLNLPMRSNSNPKKDGGLSLLKEINRRTNLTRPEAIVGLTSYPEVKSQILGSFRNGRVANSFI